MAIGVSAFAATLLLGTWLYVEYEHSKGRDARIAMHLVIADVMLPLFATHLVIDWRKRRYVKKGDKR